MPPDPLIFLIDRSLGRVIVAQRLRELGYRCLTLADFYDDEQAAQQAADTTWLDDAAPHGLVTLTRDSNLYGNAHEQAALRGGQHRVFWLGPKKGTGVAWAERFVAHHQSIVQYARRQPGPYVVKVQQRGLHRVWP